VKAYVRSKHFAVGTPLSAIPAVAELLLWFLRTVAVWHCWIVLLTTCNCTVYYCNTCRQSSAAGSWSRNFPSRWTTTQLDEGSLQQFGRRRASGVRVSCCLWRQLLWRRLQRLLQVTWRPTWSLRMRTERHYCLSSWVAGKVLYNRLVSPFVYSELINNVTIY